MQHVCSICADPIAADEWHQHPTGDYHKACFASIAAASVRVERWNGAVADCHLCHDRIAPHAIVVLPAQLVVHLRCFFDPPTTGRKSVGAAAAQPTLIEHSAALVRCSDVLCQESRRVRARARVMRDEHRMKAFGAPPITHSFVGR